MLTATCYTLFTFTKPE